MDRTLGWLGGGRCARSAAVIAGCSRGSLRKYQTQTNSQTRARDAQDDERASPGYKHEEPGNQRRRERISDARKRVGDALREAPACPRASRSTWRGWRWETRRLRRIPTPAEARTATRIRRPRRSARWQTPPWRSTAASVSRAPEFVADPAADELKDRVGNGEGGKRQAQLRVAELEIRFHQRRRGGDVHPIDEKDQVHQAEQGEDDAGGSQAWGFVW